MPLHFVLLALAGFGVYIVADAAFDVSAKMSRAAGALRRRLKYPPPPSARWNQPEDARAPRVAQNAHAGAPAAAVIRLAAIAAVALLVVFVANRFTASPGQVRAEFAKTVADAEAATRESESIAARRQTERVEAHVETLDRLAREVANANAQIADAPDLDARARIALDAYERLRLEAETGRAAALHELTGGDVSKAH